MSKLKIALIAVLVGMSIASPALARTQDRYGRVLPYQYEGETQVWRSYAQDPTNNRQRVAQSVSRPDDPDAVMSHGNKIGADPDPFIRQQILRLYDSCPD